MMTNHQFKISQLRATNQQALVEAIAVFVLALFISAFLPQLLFQYIYADMQLLEQPVIFDYIPVFSFALGVGYFLLVAWGNMRRRGKMKQLERDMELMGDDCCGQCLPVGSDEEELAEMEKIVDEILKEAEKKASKKPASKKASSKTKKASTSSKKKTTKKSSKK